MAFSLVFSLLALSAVSFAAEVPVYMFGDIAKSALKYSPLSTVLKEEFSGILREELAKDPFTVIFIEETLSVEDLSLKNEDGQSAFPFLRANIQDSAYLPSVDNALQALNQLADPEKVDHVKLTENGLSAEIEPESGKFLFISLRDAKEGESRADLLRRHNDFMEDMFVNLQQRYNKVVAIYTARFPSWTVTVHSRARRQAETLVAGHYNFTRVLLDVSTIELVVGTAPPVFLSNGAGSTVISGNEMNSTLAFSSYNLMLHFTHEGGYWLLNTVTVSNATISYPVQPDRDVYALDGFSYRCAPNVTFVSAGVNQTAVFTLTIRDMKLQAFFENTTITDYQFGESFNCVGFFSAPIWAGLFVTFTFLAITFFGIMMIMDIRTMDRFDDPKGKTITINAAE